MFGNFLGVREQVLGEDVIFGAVAESAWIYFSVATVSGAAFIGASWQMYRGRGMEGTASMFRYSTLYLAALFFAMVADTLLIG